MRFPPSGLARIIHEDGAVSRTGPGTRVSPAPGLRHPLARTQLFELRAGLGGPWSARRARDTLVPPDGAVRFVNNAG